MHAFNNIFEKRNVPRPFLYGVSRRSGFPQLTPEAYVRLLMASSASVVQLREKDLDEEQLRRLLQAALAHRRPAQVVIANSALRLALEEGADGCHLTSRQSLIEARKIRADAGREKDFLLGKSVHSVQDAVQAEAEGADYIILGPIFAPLSKVTADRALGVSALREAVQMLYVPVVAIGGIEPANLQTVWATGAAGAAGITWLERELSRILARAPLSAKVEGNSSNA